MQMLNLNANLKGNGVNKSAKETHKCEKKDESCFKIGVFFRSPRTEANVCLS
jgi:hypothetical protein